ncbi:SGNH/GDSL hydrolase family protein [Calothrix sp. 336/3]|uniref:SGNH/GDSL hydrolase family protein n=1 Tax=Calothrix sp. 336/3 TaxID=1337936 RepID=UPI0004E2CF4B|nr:SGNH/GDSL hydrolase family protein [Calothrix sp. 336/3]AKG24439.1 G-D-S-L family lipolytic protein [Calothrix sp. 336/3]
MSTSANTLPKWAVLSLLSNGILILAVILLLSRQQGLTAFFGITSIKSQNQTNPTTQVKKHQLNYQQWLDVLKQEAKIAAEKRPPNLSILAGDSLSLWFPLELLPESKNWLNQGISGESSGGLLKRLNLFDQTQPKIIFVMIGINDLIRGISDQVILENYQQIMAELRQMHPDTQIVIQSILPHASENATWEGRDKLLAIPNSRIRQLNRKIQAIATEQGVKYLDLHPLFVNNQGNLRPELTTDGLHLSPQGYLVWSSALQLYSQMELGSKE